MNNLRLHVVALVIVLSCLFVPLNNAFAIGKWLKGTVTERPWTSDYSYIKIDNVTYTIMESTKAVYVYTSNGAQYKNSMLVSSIRRGDTLLVKVEGNRIYQIEKIR
jgi:hypothetical protein